MKLLIKGLCCLALLLAGVAQARPVALFYLMETQKSLNSFEAHAEKIDLVVPTWYGVDAHGLVQGAPNAYVLDLAGRKHVPVMPILSMTAGRDGFHALLGDPAAKREMIAALLREARLHGYTGFQFDFENIAWTDREAFTLLARQTAEALHKAGLKLSIAVVPNAPGYAGRGPFAKWMWEYWRGAYDLAALAKAADLICLMSYDQHTRWTPPGPVAGMPWVMEQLDYALKTIPKEKLSLGIALYGYRWYAGNPVEDGKEHSNIAGAYIDADESFPLARQTGAKIRWDEDEHEAWYYFYRDQMREWVFMSEARGFRDRYEVVKQYGLQGFCAWVLGAEDPAIWEQLPAHP